MDTDGISPELVVLGHTAAITALAFSPDGRTLLSGGYDRTVIAWDWEAGTMRRLLTGQGEDGFSAAAFSPDGRVIAGQDDGGLTLWDAAGGQTLRTMSRRFDPFAFSPDGRTLASVALDPHGDGWALVLASARTGRVRRYVPCGEHQPEGLAFTADGRAVATVAWAEQQDDASRYEVTVAPVTGGAPSRRLWEGNVCLFGTSAFPGVRLAALASDGARLWDAETGALLRTVHDGGLWHYFESQAAALSPDGATVAAGNSRGGVWVWGASPEQTWAVQGHDGWARALAFSPDGTTLATAGDDCLIRLWETATGEEKGALGIPRRAMAALAFGPEGRTLTVGNGDPRVWLWSLDPCRLDREVTVAQPWGDDGTGEAALCAGLDLFHDEQSKTVFSPDGGRAVTASRKGAAVLWEVAGGRRIAALRGLHAWARPFAFSADGSLLATGGEPNAIQVWDAATGRVLRRWDISEKHDEAITLAFSADGRTLASGHVGYAVQLWDVRTGRRKRTLGTNRDGVAALAFAPDGGTLAVGTAYDDIVWLRGLGRRGRRKRALRGHTGGLCALAYSPDGRWLASGAADSTVRIWDAADGRLVVTLRVLPPADWVAFTPAGDYACSAGAERFLLWRVNRDLVAADVYAPAFRRDSLSLSERELKTVSPPQSGVSRGGTIT